MPVDPAQLDALIGKIHATYGGDSVHTGDKIPPVARIPTGNIELDWAMNGGVPRGRWCHFYGGFSSCKTLTCYNTILNAQQMGLTCAYYNAEKQYDESYAKKLGIKTKDLLIVEGTTIEGVGAKLEALLGAVHVHVIDSLASCVSLDELNAEVEEWRPGRSAAAWGKVIRRSLNFFDEVENTVIMVNQVRDAFQSYGGQEQAPGGRSIDFVSSMTVLFRRAGWMFKDGNGILADDGGAASLSGDKQPDGMEFSARVLKSRVGPPLRTARMRLDFESGQFDELWTLSKAAKYFNIAEKTSPKSSYYKLPDGSTVQGEMKIRQAIEADPKLQKQIREAMLAAA